MKKIIYFFVIAFLPLLSVAQIIEKQTDQGDLLITDSIKSIIPVARQSLLKDVDIIANTRFAYESKYINDVHDYSSFNVNQFRLEIKGMIHKNVYFRFRNKYTSEVEVGTIDHISKSVDVAFLRFDITPKTSFEFGKLCADWGGYEFDFNPIDILQYNDILNNADNFLTGAGISHKLNKKHTFTFQVLNSRTNLYGDQYGATAPPELVASKYPLAVVGNWRGSLFNNKFQTTWSYNFFNEAKGANMNYIALGNKFQPNARFVAYYDFQYTMEGLDRTGIITRIVNNQNPNPIAVRDTNYMDHWIRAEWLASPKVNLLLTLMNSNHYWYGNPDSSAGKKLSTSYGVIPTVQYLPYQDLNLKFYLGFVYRNFTYSDYAKSSYGVSDNATSLLTFGIIAPLLVL